MNKGTFNNDLYEGKQGKLVLELSKTYKGDSRFKLDERFKDDIDVDKLPQKFREITDKEILEKMQKTKKIKKDKPLIIQRFEPGTVQAQNIIKKAEGIKKYEDGLKRHNEKIKKKAVLERGIDRIKKAEMILNETNKTENEAANTVVPKFKITVNGNRKEAFKQADFKLFG